MTIRTKKADVKKLLIACDNALQWWGAHSVVCGRVFDEFMFDIKMAMERIREE